MTEAANSNPLRLPSEWEPQECVWLSWPHNPETWPNSADASDAPGSFNRFDNIPALFAHWARLIAESTPVRILAAGDVARQCSSMLKGVRDIDILDIATNDCWIRDYGPSFVINQLDGTLHGVDWKYNAWGGKYPPWDLDDAVGPQLCRAAEIRCVHGGLCLEGGALEVDGHGRLLTTPDCLINENRNPGWSKRKISLELHRRLGVTEIAWLDGGGLVGDDTDGHVDQLARFIDQENVVAAVCGRTASEKTDDPNCPGLEDNFRQLHLWGDATSPQVKIHRLPIPPARLIDGRRVPESYCNFLRLGTERLLVPTFAANTDDYAIGLLRELSGAEVIGVDCQDLVWGLGALHCASRDQPKRT